MPRKYSRKSSPVVPGDVVRKIYHGELPVTPVPEGESESTGFFEGASAEQRVRLYREDERSKRFLFHGILSLEEANEEFVARTFGGGKYRAQLMRRNEAGVEVITLIHGFEVPGPYRPPLGDLPGVMPRVVAVPGGEVRTVDPRLPPGTTASDLMNNALLGKVMDLLKPTAPPRVVDWAPLVTAAGGILTALLANTNRGMDPDLKAALDDLRSSVKNQPGPNTNAVSDVTKAIRELMGVKQMLAGDVEKPDAEAAMWKLGEQLLGALAQRGTAPAPTAPVAVGPSTASLPAWHQMLLHYQAQLVDAARRGIDARFAADVADQFMPPNLVGVTTEFMRRPDAATIMQQVLAPLAEFPTWTADFCAAMRAVLLPEPEENGEDAESDTAV